MRRTSVTSVSVAKQQITENSTQCRWFEPAACEPPPRWTVCLPSVLEEAEEILDVFRGAWTVKWSCGWWAEKVSWVFKLSANQELLQRLSPAERFSWVGELTRSHVSAQTLFVRDVSMMCAVKRTGLKTLVLNLTQNVDARSGAAVWICQLCETVDTRVWGCAPESLWPRRVFLS